MTNSDKALQLLGLVRRAGKLVTGESFVLAAVRDGSAKMVLLANDAGKSSQKQFRDKTTSYQVELIETFTKDQLSTAIGAARTVIAITDPGFVRKLHQLLSA
ncbi:ribosomal protein HS6-type (S12 L30 L7a) [Levilactobacillus senmaizukei DSM 21775 = NBRC 103853]|uniref:Ribosomal protein HS6-type (S12 L30 L7a) n=2 Tax=Levilactobacillus TaxID=2767886 RepID=A0A0R2DGL5_9LACO|nr:MULTISPECIES: ribosomal L7Ae/L30e/S12e/Gadd45 family protein [Levilactobacillus]KRN02758.1 ribosomal protein HS6-type (S12 L30 L7a) [Levilactobacillus senmaizukei DSM 21775 = NBRC 103853]